MRTYVRAFEGTICVSFAVGAVRRSSDWDWIGLGLFDGGFDVLERGEGIGKIRM